MITGCSVCMQVHVTQQCYHHPPWTHKCYTILPSNARDLCKHRTVLFFIMIGTTVKPWAALSIVFEDLLVESHSLLLYSSIYNLEEQFAASIETVLRDTDDYNVDNLENMRFESHIWQHGQLKSKGITPLIRPSIAYFSYRDPSSTPNVKPSMKVRPVFLLFVLGLLHLNLHSDLMTLLPSREWKRCWWRAEWVP